MCVDGSIEDDTSACRRRKPVSRGGGHGSINQSLYIFSSPTFSQEKGQVVV